METTKMGYIGVMLGYILVVCCAALQRFDLRVSSHKLSYFERCPSNGIWSPINLKFLRVERA